MIERRGYTVFENTEGNITIKQDEEIVVITPVQIDSLYEDLKKIRQEMESGTDE